MIPLSLEELKPMAAAVAAELKAAASVSPELRRRFIDVRTALFQRGIYDPVLVRFDSATAPKASTQEIADQLEKIAGS